VGQLIVAIKINLPFRCIVIATLGRSALSRACSGLRRAKHYRQARVTRHIADMGGYTGVCGLCGEFQLTWRYW
jgi:hypothetical protein